MLDMRLQQLQVLHGVHVEQLPFVSGFNASHASRMRDHASLRSMEAALSRQSPNLNSILMPPSRPTSMRLTSASTRSRLNVNRSSSAATASSNAPSEASSASKSASSRPAVDENGAIEILASLHDAMTDRVDLGQRRDSGALARDQGIKHERDSVIMVRHLRVDDHFVIIKTVLVERLGRTDALANALGHERMRFNIDKLVLQRR